MPRSTFDDPVRELIKGRNFCHVATLNENGSIHATLVWIDVDGDTVILNSARGRRWPTNVERTGRASLLVAPGCTTAASRRPSMIAIRRDEVSQVAKRSCPRIATEAVTLRCLSTMPRTKKPLAAQV